MHRSPDSIADELAVRDLVADFADGATRLDARAVASLFAPEGVWEVPGWGTNRGPGEILPFVEELFSHWDGLFHAAHTCRIWVQGDEGRGWWHVTEFGKRDNLELRVAGVYHDEYIRLEGQWRFARRRFDIVFRRIGGCSEVETWPLPGP